VAKERRGRGEGEREGGGREMGREREIHSPSGISGEISLTSCLEPGTFNTRSLTAHPHRLPFIYPSILFWYGRDSRICSTSLEPEPLAQVVSPLAPPPQRFPNTIESLNMSIL